MLWKQRKNRLRDVDEDTPARPSALTLVMRILQSPFDNDMLWLSVSAVLLAGYLHFNHIGNDGLTALVFIALAAIALLRGCRAWQRDLNDYHRHLSLKHHREARGNSNGIPGYYPTRHF